MSISPSIAEQLRAWRDRQPELKEVTLSNSIIQQVEALEAENADFERAYKEKIKTCDYFVQQCIKQKNALKMAREGLRAIAANPYAQSEDVNCTKETIKSIDEALS